MPVCHEHKAAFAAYYAAQDRQSGIRVNPWIYDFGELE
jgi:hypothetical protein